jgi:hypothetical protein
MGRYRQTGKIIRGRGLIRRHASKDQSQSLGMLGRVTGL